MTFMLIILNLASIAVLIIFYERLSNRIDGISKQIKRLGMFIRQMKPEELPASSEEPPTATAEREDDMAWHKQPPEAHGPPVRRHRTAKREEDGLKQTDDYRRERDLPDSIQAPPHTEAPPIPDPPTKPAHPSAPEDGEADVPATPAPDRQVETPVEKSANAAMEISRRDVKARAEDNLAATAGAETEDPASTPSADDASDSASEEENPEQAADSGSADHELADAKSAQQSAAAARRIDTNAQERLTAKPKADSAANPPSGADTGRKTRRRFAERHPDLEKFIGENLMNKIGIGILVLGIGFFVKYAIDKEWISEIGRICIGLLSGGVLLLVGHRLRDNYKAFSSVLAGGALTVFYFTIAIAFHEYGQISQTVAFILMLGVTSLAVMMSIAYDKLELAILALIGGFVTPFLVSTGSGNYVVLFTYVMILNAGMIGLAYFKKWNSINYIAYLSTIFLYGGWLVQQLWSGEALPVAGALTFASLFYISFFAMTVIYNVKAGRKFNGVEFMMLLSNTFLFYSAGMAILKQYDVADLRGLFTLTIGVFNFVFAFLFYRRKSVDRNLVYTLIGLTLTSFILAVPIQLQGSHITLFWAGEALMLIWLAQRSGIKLMRYASVAVNFLMLISLAMDWYQIYGPDGPQALTVFFNKAFVTSLISILSLIASLRLLRSDTTSELLPGIPLEWYRRTLQFCAVLCIYFGGFFELLHQVHRLVDSAALKQLMIASYNYGFLLLSILFTRARSHKFSQSILGIGGLLAIALYLLYFNGVVAALRNAILLNGSPGAEAFFFHYVLVAMVIAMVPLSRSLLLGFSRNSPRLADTLTWLGGFALVFIASAELEHLVLLAQYQPGFAMEEILRSTRLIGYPILWGLCSLAMMVVGMRSKNKTLRIMALSLFALTLVKLFVFDLSAISQGGKIAAFISLGLLLLIVSFLYQRLKSLLLDGEVSEEDARKESGAESSL